MCQNSFERVLDLYTLKGIVSKTRKGFIGDKVHWFKPSKCLSLNSVCVSCMPHVPGEKQLLVRSMWTAR